MGRSAEAGGIAKDGAKMVMAVACAQVLVYGVLRDDTEALRVGCFHMNVQYLVRWCAGIF